MNEDFTKVSAVVTKEHKKLMREEAEQKHGGSYSHLLRTILDDRYKLTRVVRRKWRGE